MVLEISMFILSFIIISLGGLCLILQKVYKVDTETGEQTTVDLPFFGKLSTNYPALAFVFIGAGLAFFTFNKTYMVTENWSISGQIKPPPGMEKVKWEGGKIHLSPPLIDWNVKVNGEFDISGILPKNKTFEDVVEQIAYEYQFKDGDATTFVTAKILPVAEYDKYRNKERGLLVYANGNKRVYDAVEADAYFRP